MDLNIAKSTTDPRVEFPHQTPTTNTTIKHCSRVTSKIECYNHPHPPSQPITPFSIPQYSKFCLSSHPLKSHSPIL